MQATDLELRADELRVKQALLNVVANAIKFTPPKGRITVAADLTPRGGIRISVQDTGIGIAAEHVPRLTERFYRVDRSRSRATGGTGLGLAIVKHVLMRHQAELLIESAPSQGSRFTVRLPPRRVHTLVDATSSDAPAGSAPIGY